MSRQPELFQPYETGNLNVLESALYLNQNIVINQIVGLAYINNRGRNNAILVIRPKNLSLTVERKGKDKSFIPAQQDSGLTPRLIHLADNVKRIVLGEGEYFITPCEIDVVNKISRRVEPGLLLKVESKKQLKKSEIGTKDSRFLQIRMYEELERLGN